MGYRTLDWSWREKIKINDIVDIFDSAGKWILGTVLDTRNDENGIKKLYLGFRVYFPTGTKVDSVGRRHEGWSSQYDLWLPAYSIRIQKYHYFGLTL